MFSKKDTKISASNRRIEIKFNSYGVAAFVIVITILFSSLYTITNTIVQNTAKNFAELYSYKTTAQLNSAIIQDLSILKSVANSAVVKDWLADESNIQKKQRAFRALNDYLTVTKNNILYFGIEASGGEFNVDRDTTFETFKPFATLDKLNEQDSWYFEAANSPNEYELNVDTDKILKRTLVWINHKVLDNNGKILGVVATGITFDKILSSAFQEHKNMNIRGVVVDRNGLVQLDSYIDHSTFMDNSTLDFAKVFPYPELNDKLYPYLASIEKYTATMPKPEVITLQHSYVKNDYAVITPIVNTDWSVVTFFDSSLLFSFHAFIPILWVSLALFIVYVVIMGLLSRRLFFTPLTRLIQSLTLASKASISDGSIQKEAIYGVERKDELGLLANTIQDLREILAQKNKELTLSAEKAEAANEAKSHFLANMSHEIRTPMNGILGLLHLLNATPLNNIQKDYVEKIVISAQNLTRIINDILDFSKIEAGKLEMEKQPFLLQGIGRDVVDLYGHACTEKGLVLDISCGENSKVYVLGDALRLKQVIFNLISNAIKFTSAGGKVLFEVDNTIYKNEELHCSFSVSDTGIGLSKAQTEKLFSAFTQADATVTRKYGGTGLGLVISKRIIKTMGGDIWVDSELGKGTTFFFTVKFPLATEACIQQMRHKELDDKTLETASLTGHLLLAEDNEINQIVAQEILQAAGFTLDIAGNGQEALDLLEKNDYDAVLMDIQMPIMDGYTATQNIRKQAKYAQLPIIAMSAHAMKGDKELSLSKGLNDHVTKPIDAELLYKTLRFWIAKKA